MSRSEETNAEPTNQPMTNPQFAFHVSRESALARARLLTEASSPPSSERERACPSTGTRPKCERFDRYGRHLNHCSKFSPFHLVVMATRVFGWPTVSRSDTALPLRGGASLTRFFGGKADAKDVLDDENVAVRLSRRGVNEKREGRVVSVRYFWFGG